MAPVDENINYSRMQMDNMVPYHKFSNCTDQQVHEKLREKQFALAKGYYQLVNELNHFKGRNQKKCEQWKKVQFQMVSLINELMILIYSVIIRKSTLDFHQRIDLNMEGILVELLLPQQISSTHTHTSHFPM